LRGKASPAFGYSRYSVSRPPIEQEEYRSSGVQEFRSSGVQEFRSLLKERTCLEIGATSQAYSWVTIPHSQEFQWLP